MSTVRVRLALAFSAGNITKAATPSFASPARFQNPGQAYLRYNVVWKPEEWIPKYRPREAGGMDAQVQKKGFAEKPEELVHAAEEFERDGYAPSGSPVKMIPSPFGSPVKKILNDDEKVPDLTNPASAYVAADATADGQWGPCEVLVLAGPPCGQGCNRAQCSNRLNSKALHGPASIAGGPPWAVGLDVAPRQSQRTPVQGPPGMHQGLAAAAVGAEWLAGRECPHFPSQFRSGPGANSHRRVVRGSGPLMPLICY